jgi:hypothetical protein
MRPSYDWEEPFEAAILETCCSNLQARIDAAQSAINRRVEEMNANHQWSPEERYAIETAQAGLDVLCKVQVQA